MNEQTLYEELKEEIRSDAVVQAFYSCYTNIRYPYTPIDEWLMRLVKALVVNKKDLENQLLDLINTRPGPTFIPKENIK